MAQIVTAVIAAQDAYEYDQDFYPDDDGYAGYSNDAKGRLWEVTCSWSDKDRKAFVCAFEGRHEHLTVQEVVLW